MDAGKPQRETTNTRGEPDEPQAYYVQVCFGKHCTPAGARATLWAMEDEIAAQGLAERVTVVPSSCRNRCDFGPSVDVLPDMTHYAYVDAAAARRIAREHLAGGVPVRAHRFMPPASPVPPAGTGKRVFTFDPAAFRPRDDDDDDE